MKRYLFLFLALCCLQAARPQEYIIKEAQMQKLEGICLQYKANNQSLTEQLNASVQDSRLLREQLKTERELTASLNNSLTKSELNAATIEAERDELMVQVEKQKAEIQRQKNIVLRFLIVTIALSLFVFALLIALFKK